MRAFDAGWGGAVWKTIGEPIMNVSSRYSSVDWNGQRMMGFNNIELISDRPVEMNLREIAEVKKRYPKNAVIASLMVESKREAWHEIVKRAEDAGADGLELNFGCPHGMSERGMGSAVGQVPEYARDDYRVGEGEGAHAGAGEADAEYHRHSHGGARGEARRRGWLSAINTINSITGIDLDTFVPRPNVDGKSSHGGYCGPAVKPIALNMVQQIMADREGCAAAFGHRRDRDLARCGGVFAAGLRNGAGVHGGDALRLSHRRRHDRGPGQLDAREGFHDDRGFSRVVVCRESRSGST